MKKCIVLITASLGIIFYIFSTANRASTYAQEISNDLNKAYSLTNGKSYDTNEALVEYTTPPTQINPNVATKINNNIYIIKRPQGESYVNFLSGLEEDNNINSISPNYVSKFASLPNNVDITQQQNLPIIHAPIVDNSGFNSSLGGSSNIVVAVEDSGVAYENYTDTSTGIQYAQAPGLSYTNFVDPYNALAAYEGQTQYEYLPLDTVGHGTYVSGIIASSANQDSSGSSLYGTAGIAFNASIMPIEIGDSNGIPLGAEIMGIQWAIDHNANIINLSIESSSPSSIEEAEIEDAINNGITVVASSGNTGASTLSYPAGYPNVIAVGATNAQGTLASYSAYGCSSYNNCQTLVAPVGDISPLLLQQTYTGYDAGNATSYTSFSNESLEGTSFSAPQVSAAIALYESKYGIQSPGSILLLLKESSSPIGGINTTYGYGLLNINAMLQIQSPSQGYDILESNGSVNSFGNNLNYGGVSNTVYAPVDISTTSNGYYILTSNGAVYTLGNAQFFGSMYNILNALVRNSISISSMPDGEGYYILTSDGAVYTFGNAQFYGSMYNIPGYTETQRNMPIGIYTTSDGNGYYILTSNGEVYTFGDAVFYGSMYNISNPPSTTTIGLYQTNGGYYLVTNDGAVYTFGNAQFYGSMYNIQGAPSYVPIGFKIVNGGYYILTKDGAIYTFGNAQFFGSVYNKGYSPVTLN
jgi:hypothetical protein